MVFMPGSRKQEDLRKADYRLTQFLMRQFMPPNPVPVQPKLLTVSTDRNSTLSGCCQAPRVTEVRMVPAGLAGMSTTTWSQRGCLTIDEVADPCRVSALA